MDRGRAPHHPHGGGARRLHRGGRPGARRALAPGRAARRAAAREVPARRPRAPAGGGGEPGQRLGLEVLDPGCRRTGRWRVGRSASRTTCAWPASRCSTARRSWRASSRARTRPWSRGCWTRARTSSARPPCPAFCFDGGGLTGYPEPQPVNPHRADHMAGSSSNGSVVVVVNGEADMALGGDQGGSIRLPASWGGCCGHKPTFGLVPYTGIFPIELTLDHVGPMARTVADCALMLDAIAGEDGLDPRQIDVSVQDYAAGLEVGAEGLRVGVLREGFGIPDASEADVDAAVRAAADVLAGAGATRRGGLGPDAPRRAGDLERDRDRGRDRPDGPRRRLRHQPQGPLLDRPRRLLRPCAPRARHGLLGHGQAHRAARRLPVRRLQPPLLRQGAEPRAAVDTPSTRPRSSASTCCCCRRRR